MRIFMNLPLLILPLLTVCVKTSWAAKSNTNDDLLQSNNKNWENPAVFVNTSWTVNKKTEEDLLRDKLVNNYENGKTPASGSFKQIDYRLSDIIAENVLHFGHSLGLELASLDPHATKSEIFSPLSVIAALSLLTLGAKGKSYQELKQLLGLDSDNEIIQNPILYHHEFGLMLDDLQHTNTSSSGVNKRPNANWRNSNIRIAPVRWTNLAKVAVEHIIKVANGLFVRNGYTLNPDYCRVLQSIYKTELTELNFQTRSREARDYINAWVNKATFGKIPQVIEDDIDKSTNIILASALYFKAPWETSFFFESTAEDNFYPDGVNSPPIKVQMMPTGGIFPFYDAQEYDCRIIGLPYKGNETTMYVIQPNNSNRQRLRDLQHILTAHKINGMIDNMERKTAIILFPKMHFTRSLHMKKLLQRMNVNDIFLYGYSDLSLIVKTSDANFERTTNSEPTTFAKNYSAEQLTPETLTTESATASFESIHRKRPVFKNTQYLDRFNEPAHIFTSRFGAISNDTKILTKRDTFNRIEKPLIANPIKEGERQSEKNINIFTDPDSLALWNLESNRQKIDSYRGDLYVHDIVHSVNFSVDEQGTEAAAATHTYLHRSGTDVVFRGDAPFLIVIRHDPTKLPLFYGIINKPEL